MWMWLIILGTSAWVLYDASSIGVRKGVITGLGDMGPVAWFVACLLLWIIAFPMYLIKRSAFIAALKSDGPARTAPSGASGPRHSAPLADLEKLAELRAKGILSEEEFLAKKREMLG